MWSYRRLTTVTNGIAVHLGTTQSSRARGPLQIDRMSTNSLNCVYFVSCGHQQQWKTILNVQVSRKATCKSSFSDEMETRYLLIQFLDFFGATFFAH